MAGRLGYKTDMLLNAILNTHKTVIAEHNGSLFFTVLSMFIEVFLCS